jgi:hypothetical protein
MHAREALQLYEDSQPSASAILNITATLPDLGLCVRAGDENRTRTISLGTRPDRPLSAHACYSCMSGPLRCPADAPESGPVRTVCETSVRRGARMIKLSELDTSRIERAWELLNKRLYLITAVSPPAASAS